MTPIAYPLALYRGDTYRWRFVLWQDAEKTQPVDLTGATAKAEIRDKPAGAVITPMTCTVVTPNNVDVLLTAAASRLVVSGVWDLQLTLASGDVQTPVAGAVVVTPDVTDSTGALMSAGRLAGVS